MEKAVFGINFKDKIFNKITVDSKKIGITPNDYMRFCLGKYFESIGIIKKPIFVKTNSVIRSIYVSIKFNVEMLEYIQKRSIEKGISQSQFVKECINNYL